MSYALSPAMVKLVPDGDTHERMVCDHCGFVNYQNPKIVVGSLVRHEDKILLCRRAIAPGRGLWTIPAGYLELHETPEDGARREALEEAHAELEILSLLAVYSVAHLSQVQLFYRARLASPNYSAGDESLEVALFDWDKIPWEEIAFPTVNWALHHDREIAEGRSSGPIGNPADKDLDAFGKFPT